MKNQYLSECAICGLTVAFHIFMQMVKKVISLFLACLFLFGGIILPLSDFSLMKDIPFMYHNYSKLATAEEFGLIDFIGDYLLHGKEIFGHNSNDKQQNGNSVQFQHRANPLNVVFLYRQLTLVAIANRNKEYLIPKELFSNSDYQKRLFRPPLT